MHFVRSANFFLDGDYGFYHPKAFSVRLLWGPFLNINWIVKYRLAKVKAPGKVKIQSEDTWGRKNGNTE
jgi:hypothetical protein